jgi:ArsR family transcriptional regulator
MRVPANPGALERAARLFRAMGDASRLRLLELLNQGEQCVGELVALEKENFSTISQRLRLLHSEGLVRRRRKGKHVYYSLRDRHVADLIDNALAHAMELDKARPNPVAYGDPIPPRKETDS